MGTYFFERYMNIIDFIYKSVMTYPEMYNVVTRDIDIAENVAKLLQSDPRLHTLKLDRGMFSFRNGIFNARNGIFYPHGTSMYTSDLCTSNYFDVPYLDKIETPCFDNSIRHYGEKGIYWFQAMLGRTLHTVGTMDDWQICLQIRNSAILRSWSEVYPIDLMIYYASISEFNAATSRFNSYAIGVEEYKFFRMPLKTPVIFTTNSDVPIKAGPILRFIFDESVYDLSKYRAELPYFMIKCARRYLDAAMKYTGRSILERDILPAQCLYNLPPLIAFFESGLLEMDDTYVMTVAELRIAYQDFLMTKESIMKKDLKLDRRELAIELSRHKLIIHAEGPDRYPRVNMLMPGHRQKERIYGMRVRMSNCKYF
jgi:hypothetical protein